MWWSLFSLFYAVACKADLGCKEPVFLWIAFSRDQLPVSSLCAVPAIALARGGMQGGSRREWGTMKLHWPVLPGAQRAEFKLALPHGSAANPLDTAEELGPSLWF